MTTVTPKIDFKQYCRFIGKTPYAVASGKLSPTPHSLPFPHQLLALPADGPLPLFTPRLDQQRSAGRKRQQRRHRKRR